MKKFVIVVFICIFFTTGYTQKTSSAYDPYLAATFDLLNNKPFLQLQLEDTSGHIFNTLSLKGKTIYVDFWFTSCPPCLKEIPFSKSLQQFFTSDTNVVFLNICIDNIERKQSWKQMIRDKKMQGIHLFYVRNRPQKFSLITTYEITFPTYLLVNKNMEVIGYNAPRPSEKVWAHWAIIRAEKNIFLSESYRELVNYSNDYKNFINANRKVIDSLQP